MNFVAMDVETANANMASICSIGIVRFENGNVSDEWYSLVNPQDHFDGMNISIHGITEDMVKGAPVFIDVASTIHVMLQDAVTVTHTHFDRVATQQACSRSEILAPACTWLDSARVARRAWAECASSGYGLANVCRLIGFEFEHHHALEDARAAGHIMLAAMQKTGLDLEGWLARVRKPINPSTANSGRLARREGDPSGPLYGEVVVFTGALSIPRGEAADMAASAGCEVNPAITKKTTLLVVGDTDVQKLAGHDKSSKHRKAEAMMANGHPMRIVRETDFRELVAMD